MTAPIRRDEPTVLPEPPRRLAPVPDLRTPGAATPLLDASTAARLEEIVRTTVAGRAHQLLEVSPELVPVVEAAQDAAAGGKRLRGALVWWGWRGGCDDGVRWAGRASEQVVLRVAAAVELFHLAALVHDDVMDHSALRRGRPTVRATFDALHRRTGLDGDPEAYGDAVAVLVGDLCLTWSDRLFASATTELEPGALLGPVRHVYDVMRSEVMAGQYLDLLEQQRRGTSLEDLRRVTTYKSAKYTVEQPLLLGARLAGASPGLLADYSAYGLAVGEAFQLRDDLLGVFGDPTVTGKPAGEDVREGKRTLLVALAEQRADHVERQLLRAFVGHRDLTEADLEAVQEVLVGTGAVDEVERRIADLVAGARRRLEDMPVPSEVREQLDDVATACAWRTT